MIDPELEFETDFGGTKRRGDPLFSEPGVLEKRQRFEEDKIIELIVGGKKIATLQSTLTKIQPSLLYDYFSTGNVPFPMQDGCYVMDRPKKAFIAILNYLRTGKFYVPKDPQGIAELEKEIEFFGLQHAYTSAAAKGKIH